MQSWGLEFHSLEPTEKCLAWEQILVIPGLEWKYADQWFSLTSHISLLSDLYVNLSLPQRANQINMMPPHTNKAKRMVTEE